jgi:hypothetical protein
MEGREVSDRSERASAASLFQISDRARIEGGVWYGQS